MNTTIKLQRSGQHLRLIQSAEVKSSGIYLPNQKVKSVDLMNEIRSSEQYGIDPSWLSETVGIKERRYIEDSETPSEMAITAAVMALDECPNTTIDKVVFCGIDKDQCEPATAHTINSKLGLNARDAYDITDACFGFMRGLHDCVRSIQLGEIQTALIVTGEQPSRIAKEYVKRMRAGVSRSEAIKIIGFLTVGDAAGAFIVGRSESENGFSNFITTTCSSHRDLCYYKRDGNGSLCGQMKMGHLTAHGKKIVRQIADDVKSLPNWREPKVMLSHNTGHGAFNAHVDLGLAPRDKWYKTYETLGNITTATLPVNFHLLSNSQHFESGDKLGGMFNGSGLVFGYFDYTI